jgi:hypothetical protein
MIDETAPVFPGGDPPQAVRSPARRKDAIGEKQKKRPGGQRKPLKRLDSDKGIQGNPSLFLGASLARLGWALLDLAKFAPAWASFSAA